MSQHITCHELSSYMFGFKTSQHIAYITTVVDCIAGNFQRQQISLLLSRISLLLQKATSLKSYDS